MAGAAALWAGDLAASRQHLERSAQSRHATPHAQSVLYDATNPDVACRAQLALVLWVLGYPAPAAARSREAVVLARRLAHPYSLCYALTFAGTLQSLRHDPRQALAHGDEAVELAAAHGFPFWQAMGAALAGWARAARSAHPEGVARMQQGLETLDRLGAQVGRTGLLVLLAEACEATGQRPASRRALDLAQAQAEHSGERLYAAEILRLRGELLLADSGVKRAEPERLFRAALDLARAQGAHAWELRAATSLARLWERRGDVQAARDLLMPVCDWFRDRGDSGDLRTARGVLATLHAA
jgi:predicted ATPase